MITDEERQTILSLAYVPEHSVGLMTSVSGGEPYLLDGYFCCLNEDWLIVVGYPLGSEFRVDAFEASLKGILRKLNPSHVSLLAPELPSTWDSKYSECDREEYFTLDSISTPIKPRLQKVVDRTRPKLVVERAYQVGTSHYELIEEFLLRVAPSRRIRTLYSRVPEHVGASTGCMVLNAWSLEGRLVAFYVVDLAAKDFSTYIIGCHSRETHIPGASDVLLHEMIGLSNDHEKHYVHLGFGVNKGIRQFKKKWGGKPTRRCRMAELILRKTSLLETVTGYLRSR